jgi:tetratricopeptide (TPR) repeat protein
MQEQGDARGWDAAERSCLQALDVATREGRQPAVYRIYLGLASLHAAQHEHAEAEKYYQLAHNLAKAHFGDQTRQVMNALYGLGEIWLKQGRIREAEGAFHQVLKILESDKDANRLDTGVVLNTLAAVQHMNGNFSKAAKLMRKVVGIFEADPAADAEGFGIALSNLATMLREVGTLPEAMTTAEKAVSILERFENSEGFALSLAILGLLQLDNSDSARSETLLQRALSIDSLRREDSLSRAVILSYLGLLYGRTGRPREAERFLQSAIEINQHLLAPGHPTVLRSMDAYAAFLRSTKRKGEAKKLEAYIREQLAGHEIENPAMSNTVDVSALMRQKGR